MPSSSCVLALDEPPNQLVDLAVGEMRVHLARMHRAALAHELEHRLRLLPARRPSRPGARVRGCISAWWRARQEAVVDEEVFLQRQPRIAALQVAGAVADRRGGAGSGPARAPARGSGRPARSRAARSRAQRGRLEQRTGDGVTAQVIEGQGHGAMMPAYRPRRFPLLLGPAEPRRSAHAIAEKAAIINPTSTTPPDRP